MQLANICAIWIGPQLGAVHSACLRSFLELGHQVTLYSYGSPVDLPEGIVLADANQLMPEDLLFRHRKMGSLAFFSDLLRYELLSKELGLYVDCDVYCIQPIEVADYIFGWESEDFINNAILKLPMDCPALNELSSIRHKMNFIPPWSPFDKPRKRLTLQLKQLFGKGRLQDLPWGTTGPRAVTHYILKHNLASNASPIDIFYPLAHSHIRSLIDPQLHIDDIITHRSRCIHLFNHALNSIVVESAIPTGCPLDQMITGRLHRN